MQEEGIPLLSSSVLTVLKTGERRKQEYLNLCQVIAHARRNVRIIFVW
jgi:hypothetical protein